MKKHLQTSALFLAFMFCASSEGQSTTGFPKENMGPETRDTATSFGPTGIVRTIIQDKKGTIWIASWEGVFRYDGKTFTNVTGNVSPARFFSVLEDRKGNMWFSSVGSGVYCYDGKSFRNFTTKDGLGSDRVTHIYEDKSGTVWFGTEGGASLYNGKSFTNYKMSDAPAVKETDSVHVSSYQNGVPEDSWVHNDVNSVIEDKTGKFWIATRGYARIYDGRKFTTIINDNNGKPFTNVRCIIEDRKGNIWLGGNDGLWRYHGKTYTNVTPNFTGYIYEDKKGNIWTSSESTDKKDWVLSRYDEKSLLAKKPAVTEITNKPMIFGILEDDKGNIWFGAVDGAYRYDGKTITDFRK